MQIDFCNGCDLDESIITLINKEITPGLSKVEISNYYKQWKEQFDTDNDDFPVAHEIISPDFKLPADKTLVGIDFPTWFNIDESNVKRIMILGIDPLRNAGAFKEYDINKQGIIGTPYALHRKSMRERKDGNNKSYWGFIKGMLDKNYGIYLTDIFKVFFISQNIRSYNNSDFVGHKEKHLDQIFAKEIGFIRPDIIIVLGNKPLQLLEKKVIELTGKIAYDLEHNSIPILPMVHLSGLAGGGRKKYISNNLDS